MPVRRGADILQRIGANVRKLRTRHGLTQEALAERAELDLRFVQRVEAGKINFGVTALAILADALDVGASALLRPVTIAAPRPGRPPKKRTA